MSNRKSRHLARERLEHQVERAVEDLVRQNGTVYVERSGEGALDSILVQVVLRDALPAHATTALQRKLRELLLDFFPPVSTPECCAVVEQFGEKFYPLHG